MRLTSLGNAFHRCIWITAAFLSVEMFLCTVDRQSLWSALCPLLSMCVAWVVACAFQSQAISVPKSFPIPCRRSRVSRYPIRGTLALLAGLAIGVVVTMASVDFETNELDALGRKLSLREDIIGPVAEEAVFRGMQWKLLRPIGRSACLLGTSMLFLLMHVPSRLELINYGNLFAWDICAIAALGVLCGLARESGGLLAAIGLHMGHNGAISLGWY